MIQAMSPQNRQSRQKNRYRPARRGQTLIVAIAVLFVLLFIGGIFVAQVARNLQQAGRSQDVQGAYELAQAGIRHCSSMLETSEDGADWRPAPTPPMPSPNDPNGLRDPDYFWLVQGFTRINQKGGRSLVRVVYDPHPDDPRSHLLRIESIGRPGEIDPLDPTVFVQRGTAPRLRRELIAYKQIGLTDFVRSVWDKNGNGGVADFGVPALDVPLAMVIGDPTLATAPNGVNNGNLVVGAPIYCATDLRIHGDFFAYTSPRGVNTNVASEGIRVGGKIYTEPTRDVNNDGVINQNDLQAFVGQDLTLTPNPANAILPSDNPAYSTRNGQIRDGQSRPDPQGFTNSVPTIKPPSLDTTISGTGVYRNRRSTRDSGVFGVRNSIVYNTGHYGYGKGIYINNPKDLQKETSNPNTPGSYSLRADWINPNNSFAQGAWQGPFYRPPGIQIELLGDRIRFIRSDDDSFLGPTGVPMTQQGGKVLEFGLSDYARQNFVLPDGTAFQLQRFDHDGDEPGDLNKPFEDKNSYGVNVVIMTEGNARIRGVYGAITDPNGPSAEGPSNPSKVGRVHLTIVSGGTAYIEGNIVKGDGVIRNGQVTLERASTCAILARDYVCVNTTMFMSPQNQTQAWSPVDGVDGFRTDIGLSRPTFDMSFSFGVDPLEYQTVQNGSPAYLFLRHAAFAPGPALINLLVNPAFVPNAANPMSPFYRFQSVGFAPTLWHTYALGYKWNGQFFLEDKSAIWPSGFEQRSFPLFPLTQNQEYSLTQLPGYENFLRFQTDTTAQGFLANIGTSLGSGGTTDYMLGGAFVAPLDIRIEAILYAQERSFFVIPGYAANPDPEDSRQVANVNAGFRKSFNADPQTLDQPNEREGKRMYPFYNDPIDVRITIHGAVAENYTASISDQGAWLSRWGWIPERMGNSNQRVPDLHLRGLDPATINPGQDRTRDFRTPAERDVPSLRTAPNQAQVEGITRGLRFTYDPALALPYYQPTRADIVNSAPALRQQRALRYRRYAASATLPEIRQILPPAPRLPVCPDLLYFGDADRPLGQ